MKDKKIEYTDEELDTLKCYTSKTGYDIMQKKYRSVNSLLSIISETYDFNNENKIRKSTFHSTRDIRLTLDAIETLYTLACKYGSTHDIPITLYRGNSYASRIEDNIYETKEGQRKVWNTDTFLSTSNNKVGTIYQFKSDDADKISSMKLSITRKESSKRRIPFIDVNALLPNNIDFKNEAEIILPPFLQTNYLGTMTTVDAKVNIPGYCLALTSNFDDQIENENGEYREEDLKSLLAIVRGEEIPNSQILQRIKNTLGQRLSKIRNKYIINSKDLIEQLSNAADDGAEKQWNDRLIDYNNKLENGTFSIDDIIAFEYDYLRNHVCTPNSNFIKLQENIEKAKPIIAKFYGIEPEEIFIGDINFDYFQKSDFSYKMIWGNSFVSDLCTNPEILQNVKFITGDAEFFQTNISLENLNYIGGNGIFYRSNITSINPQLTIRGNIEGSEEFLETYYNLKSSTIFETGALEKDLEAIVEESTVEDLNTAKKAIKTLETKEERTEEVQDYGK